jgi:O-antigen ligase
MANGSPLLMAVAVALLVVHLGRLFDYVLVGYHIPAVICGAAAVVAALCAFRVLKTWPARAFMLFTAWMLLAVPFSYWKGGSASYVFDFVSLPFVAMLVIAAAPRNVKDLTRLFSVTAACAVLNLAAGVWLNPLSDGRLSFEGTFGNADDVAILAGFALPFLVLLAGQVRPAPLRLILQWAGAAWLIRVIGLTATRTGILALGAMLLAYLAGLKISRRLLAAMAVGLGLVLLAISLPESALQRLSTIAQVPGFSDQYRTDDDEALGSAAARQALMLDALRLTARFPLFGVGPGMFAAYRGENPGVRRSWQNTHSAYLQVSSESGVPALIFYLLFLLSIFGTIRSVRRLSAVDSDPTLTWGRSLALCLQLAWVYFVTCAMFMCVTEYVYPFILAGLALAAQRLLLQKAGAPAANVGTAPEPAARTT